MDTNVTLQSLLKRTLRSSDGQIVTTPIAGQLTVVLDNAGTARKLADNHGHVKLYVLDTNTGDVHRDENGVPRTFSRRWENVSIEPWRKTDTGTESNAQVRHAVAHCDVIRNDDGSYLLDENGNRQFIWEVIPDEYVYIANAERPELQGVHPFGEQREGIILAAQTKEP